jgi:hypothetical protein
MSDADKCPTMQGPAIYRIRVRGEIDPSFLDRLGGLELRSEDQLEGVLADQAALNGVLSVLYELHLPLVSVECLASEPGQET